MDSETLRQWQVKREERILTIQVSRQISVNLWLCMETLAGGER
jgi:hypothetical protein